MSKKKKLKWPKLFETHIPVYGGRIVLCRTHAEWEQCAQYLIKSTIEFPTGMGAHQCFEGENNYIHLVGVFNRSRSTLVHELSHACFHILGRVGIATPCGEKNEAFCYLLDTLYEECESHLRK